ncbi:hypothetical protein BGW80DRAFT_1254434 [Lactifluus volemus]|nr:hypothetical protein BGW80DRAFT_1254434 [Lactifluus volemus]
MLPIFVAPIGTTRAAITRVARHANCQTNAHQAPLLAASISPHAFHAHQFRYAVVGAPGSSTATYTTYFIVYALRTNVRGSPRPLWTYNEAAYSAASPILNGQPVQLRHEMGGFCLGSTSVLVFVFEVSPTFEFAVHVGQKWWPRKGGIDVTRLLRVDKEETRTRERMEMDALARSKRV